MHELALAAARQRVEEASTAIDTWIGSPGPFPAAARPVLSLAALTATRLLADRRQPVKTSVCLVGGAGWADDIGYSGLDHGIGTNSDWNVLQLH